MSPAPLPWLKLHRRLVECRKVRELSPRLFQTLILVWCATNAEGVLADEDGNAADLAALAWRLRMNSRSLKRSIEALIARGFLESGSGGEWRVHDWADWQAVGTADSEGPIAVQDVRRAREREKKRAQRARKHGDTSRAVRGHVPSNVPSTVGTNAGTSPGTLGGTEGGLSRSESPNSTEDLRQKTVEIPPKSPHRAGDNRGQNGDIGGLIPGELVEHMVATWPKGGSENLVFDALRSHISGAPNPSARLAVIERNFGGWVEHQRLTDPNKRTALDKAIRDGWFVASPGAPSKGPVQAAVEDDRLEKIRRGMAMSGRLA